MKNLLSLCLSFYFSLSLYLSLSFSLSISPLSLYLSLSLFHPLPPFLPNQWWIRQDVIGMADIWFRISMWQVILFTCQWNFWKWRGGGGGEEGREALQVTSWRVRLFPSSRLWFLFNIRKKYTLHRVLLNRKIGIHISCNTLTIKLTYIVHSYYVYR